MTTLPKPLYHGTAKALATSIYLRGFKPPVYLTEDKESAIHYAKAAAAYILSAVPSLEEDQQGCILYTFRSLPNTEHLDIDDYNLEGEPGQWKYMRKLKGRPLIKEFPLVGTPEEIILLSAFAVGMWRR